MVDNMTVRTYKVSNRALFIRDLLRVSHKLKERFVISSFSFDNTEKKLVFVIDASDSFHNELANLGYTSV